MENIYDYHYILTLFRKAQKTFFITSPIPFIYNLKNNKTREKLIKKKKNILSFNACLLTTYILKKKKKMKNKIMKL